jgi:hypothetical protein
MSTYSDLLDRVDRVGRRVDLVVDTHFEEARRRAKELRRSDDAGRESEERARRDRARRWDQSGANYQAAYDPIYGKFGEKAPARVADETPKRYRRKLFRGLQDKLPDGHDLIKVNADELDSDIIDQFEQMLFEAVQRESETPSGSNLPDDVYDARAKHERTDAATGLRKIEFAAKESFIKSLSRPGRKVLRLVDPTGPRVLWGAPWPTPPT